MLRIIVKKGDRVINRQGVKYGPWIAEAFDGPTDDDFVGMVHAGGKIAYTGVDARGLPTAWFTTKKAARQAVKEYRKLNHLEVRKGEIRWYIGGYINGRNGYLHKDGDFRSSTFSHDAGEFSGYYKTRRIARMTLKRHYPDPPSFPIGA